MPKTIVTLKRLLTLSGYMFGAVLLLTGWYINKTSEPAFALPNSPYQTPAIPPEFQGQISYHSKKHPGQLDTDEGADIYLKHHRGGWDDCLLYFCRGWCDFTQADKWRGMIDASDEVPWLIGAPPHVIKARRDGWLSCTDKIMELTSEMSPHALRQSLPVSNYAVPIAFLGLLAFAASVTFQRWSTMN